MLRFDFLTLFPEVFPAVLDASIIGRARQRGLIETHLTQIRDFAEGRHRQVDDSPYGGGEGMVLKADVLQRAWQSVQIPTQKRQTVFLSPQGRPLTQDLAKELAQLEQLVLVCGHYEGVDERFIDESVDLEVSIGDFVLTGGELPAMVLADAVSRWVPGVVGKEASVLQDSFADGLLKYPQYTRPQVFAGRPVPPVLMSGNHKEISKWRESQRQERTRKKRPELWAQFQVKKPVQSGRSGDIALGSKTKVVEAQNEEAIVTKKPN